MLSGYYPDRLTVNWTPLQRSAAIERKLQSTQGTPSFTLSSEIEPDMTQWQSGSSFTCMARHQNTVYSKSINICKSIPNTPPAVRLEIPSFQTVVTAQDEITATCFVHSIVKATLTWLLNDRVPSPDQVYEASNSTHVISNLTLAPSDWNKLSVLTCKAKHFCLPTTEEKVEISAPSGSPVVSIRRYLPDLLKRDSAVLECDITSLSSSDFYVTFQSNGRDISPKDFVHLSKGSGLQSISRTFSIPENYWNKNSSFSCKVSQSSSKNVLSNSTGSIFVDPSVKLLLAPSDESGIQTLSCTAWGFNPHIEWFSGSQTLSGSQISISLNSEEQVVVSSQLQVSQAEWKTGKVFSCKVFDSSLNKVHKEDVSVCAVAGQLKAPPVPLVETPSFQTVMTSTSDVTASCSVFTVFEAKVSWWVDGNPAQSHSVRQHMNSSHIISELTLSPRQWTTLGKVSCRAEHVCLPPTEKVVLVAAPSGSPVVSIRRYLPDLLKRDSAVLECDITSLSSSDFYVTFQSNGRDISPKDFVHLSKGSGLQSISRTFSIPENYWNKNSSFSCKVSQSSSKNFLSNSTGSIFVDPSVKLLLAPSDESGIQTLSCTAWGFNPHIEWSSGSQTLSGSQISISLNSEEQVVVSSQLQVSQAEWKTGKVFSCKVFDRSLNKVHKEDVSVCAVAGQLKAPPVPLVETPSFQTVMTSTSDITASCSVFTVFEAKVSWWVDGNPAQSHSVRQHMNSSHIISELTLSPRQWTTLGKVSCRAEHVCLPPTEKVVLVAAPSGSPMVSIRRYLPDLLKRDSAVLECDITSLSSSDFYVTFQSNGRDISPKDFVHLSKGSGLHSISRTFSIPENYWEKNSSFSCTVSQSSSKNVLSNSTRSIFVDPSVKLLLAPSDESGIQTLSCTARGFNPHIEWFSGSQTLSGSQISISLNSEEQVVVSSQLQVSQAEWKTGKVFSCKVFDRSLNKVHKKDISVCAVTPLASQTVGVYVQGPSLEQLQNNDQRLTVSCLLVGPSLDSFTLTWKIDEKIQSGGVHTEPLVAHKNGTQTLKSQLSLSAQDWQAEKTVFCEAKHICANHSHQDSTRKSTVLSPPNVRLTDPDLLGLSPSDPVSLDCLVSGFYPPDVIIFWEKNGIKILSSSQTNAPLWQDKDGVTYSTSSRLNISNSSEEDSTYSCVVRHESSDTPFRSTITNVFASVSPTQPSVALLRGEKELVCLVTGFSPAHVVVSWFLDNSTELHDYNTSDAHRGPDGKFSVQSHLRMSPMDMLPGAIFTCRVTHANATIDASVKEKENMDECNFLDSLLLTDEEQDIGVESWYMACVFLLCFLLSAVYCVGATLVKTK